jgi:hypothetical protein
VFIEIRYLNGDYVKHMNVDSWYIDRSGKIPILYIAELPSEYGRKEVYVNLANVLHYDVIDESQKQDTKVEIL